MLDLITKFWELAEKLGGPIAKRIRERKSRTRVVRRLQELAPLQRQILSSSMSSAKSNDGRFVYVHHGEDEIPLLYTKLTFLFDEGAATIEDDPRPGMSTYRFKHWLYDYLVEHPEILAADAPSNG